MSAPRLMDPKRLAEARAVARGSMGVGVQPPVQYLLQDVLADRDYHAMPSHFAELIANCDDAFALRAELDAERASHAKTTQALRDAVTAKACWVPRALELLKERPPCS